MNRNNYTGNQGSTDPTQLINAFLEQVPTHPGSMRKMFKCVNKKTGKTTGYGVAEYQTVITGYDSNNNPIYSNQYVGSYNFDASGNYTGYSPASGLAGPTPGQGRRPRRM